MLMYLIGVMRMNRKTKQWIREASRLPDKIEKVHPRKWNWSGHIVMKNEAHWSRRIMDPFS